MSAPPDRQAGKAMTRYRVIYDAAGAVEVWASSGEEARTQAHRLLFIDEHAASVALSLLAGRDLLFGLGNPVLIIDRETDEELPISTCCTAGARGQHDDAAGR